MEERNKIDQFFAKTMNDITKESPEWLLPSDDIWDAAKVHFPKKKKRDRKLLIVIFFGLIGLVSSIVVIHLSNTRPIETENHNIIAQQTNDSQKSIEKNTESITKITKSISTANENVKSINKQVESTSIINSSNTSASNNSSSSKTELRGVKKNNSKLGSKETFLDIKKLGKEQSETTSNAKGTKVFSKEGIKEIVDLHDEVLYKRGYLDASFLTPPSFSVESNKKVNDFSGLISLAPSIVRPLYEVGVSHRQLIFNLALEFDSPDNTKDKISVEKSYFNINTDVRKWITPKWSFQSGFWYSQLAMDLDFSVYSVLDREARDFLANQLSEFSFRSLEENNDRFSSLVFKGGTSLSIGDSINLQSKVTIGLTAYQLPFMLDYHMEKGNWEFLFGGGFSIDCVVAKQSEFDLNVFKDGILVNEPFRSDELTEHAFDYSIYTNASVRYRLKQNLYLGLTARAMISEPIFSGVELGLYYRL